MSLYQQLGLGKDTSAPLHRKTQVRLYAISSFASVLLILLLVHQWKPLGGYSIREAQNVQVDLADGTSLILDDGLLNSNNLTESECQAAFPLNYYTLLRISAYHKRRGGISFQDAEEAGENPNARIIIQDGQLHIAKYRPGYQSRAMAVIQSLYSAVSVFQLECKRLLKVYCICSDRYFTRTSAGCGFQYRRR